MTGASVTGSGVTAASVTAVTVDVLVPDRGRIPVAELLAQVAAAGRHPPYADETVEACADLSRRLAKSAAGDPAVQALAYWMRRSQLLRLRAAFAELASERTVLVPRGLVFHLPPANVDTIFVYSWLLSVLAGNSNVIRLPETRTATSDRILTALNDVLAATAGEGPDRHTTVISYGHEEEVTAALSAVCDMRVVWGGDDTVRAIRAVPLAPHATELTFGDRSSLAVLRASAFVALPADGRAAVAERLYNDAYLFDQLACSSPRTLVWVGSEGEADAASVLLLDELPRVVRARGYTVDTSTAMAKLTYRARAEIDFPVQSVTVASNELAVLTVGAPVEEGPDFCGAGLFWQTRCQTLGELAGHLGRRHQTLAHFGFDAGELRGLAGLLNGRGVDRMVPLGEALTFNRYWDGHDLLGEFLRTVYVQADPQSM